MKKPFAIYIISLVIVLATALTASAGIEDYGFRPIREPMRYKEDFFTKYAAHLVHNPDYVTRNIFLLECAYAMPWDDPIRALSPVTNEMQYAKYQNLLMMHICIMLTKEYIAFGYLYFKENIYWYNRDYFTNYLTGYDVAEKAFTDARNYWNLAVHFAQMADSYRGWRMNDNFNGIHIPFEDEVYRIKTSDLNYYPVIDDLMRRLTRNQAIVQAALTNGR